MFIIYWPTGNPIPCSNNKRSATLQKSGEMSSKMYCNSRPWCTAALRLKQTKFYSIYSGTHWKKTRCSKGPHTYHHVAVLFWTFSTHSEVRLTPLGVVWNTNSASNFLMWTLKWYFLKRKVPLLPSYKTGVWEYFVINIMNTL